MRFFYSFVSFFCLLAVMLIFESCSSSPSSQTGGPPPSDVPGNITTDFAEVVIPENVFAEKVDVSMEEGEDKIDVSELKAAHTIRSKPIRLRFSKVQMAEKNSSMTVTLILNETTEEPVHVMLRESGAQVDFGEGMAPDIWRPVFAERDESGKKIVFHLFATAERMEIVAVSPLNPQPLGIVADELQNQQAPMRIVAKSSGDPARPSVAKQASPAVGKQVGGGGGGPWNDLPWAIRCDQRNLPVGFDCGEAAMVRVATAFFDAAQYLKTLQMNEALLVQGPLVNIRRAFGQQNIFSNNPNDAGLHNFAQVTANFFCRHPRAQACWDPATNMIYIANNAFVPNDPNNPDGGVAVSGGLIAHELTHAVQRALAPIPVLKNPTSKWIQEGSAETVARSYDPFRVDFGRRDWGLSLNNTTDLLIPYQTYRFFVEANPNPAFLSAFFRTMAPAPNTYDAASTGFAASVNEGFPPLLERVYREFYKGAQITCGVPVDVANQQNQTTLLMQPVSSHCLNFKSLNGNKCIALAFGNQLGFKGERSNGVLFINDTKLPLIPLQRIETEAKEVTVQIIDINTDDETSNPKNLTVDYSLYDCADLTGTWCNWVVDVPEEPRHLRPLARGTRDIFFLRQEGNNVTGRALLTRCENDFLIGEGRVLEDNVNITINRRVGGGELWDDEGGCVNDRVDPRYDLRRVDGLLIGFIRRISEFGLNWQELVNFVRCECNPPVDEGIFCQPLDGNVPNIRELAN